MAAADGAIIDLDLCGLRCPLPVLRTRKALRAAGPGRRLRITCTDPMSAVDIPNLVREEGDRLDAIEREGDRIRFRITRSASPPQS